MRLRLCTDRRGNVTAYRISDNRVVYRLPGSGGEAKDVVRWSDDGRYAIIHHWDQTTVVWDLRNARRICARTGDFSGRVTDVAADGSLAAMLDEYNEVRLLELPSSREVRRFAAPPDRKSVV